MNLGYSIYEICSQTNIPPISRQEWMDGIDGMDGMDGMDTSPTESWNDCLHYNRTTQIPPLQISRREPQHTPHPPFHLPQTYYSIFIDHCHFSSILYHIILLLLDFPLLMSSQVVHCRAQSSIIHQAHPLHRPLMNIRFFGYSIFVQPAGTRHAQGEPQIRVGIQTYSFKHCQGLQVSKCPSVQ